MIIQKQPMKLQANWIKKGGDMVTGLTLESVTTPFIQKLFQAMEGQPLIFGFNALPWRDGQRRWVLYLVYQQQIIPLSCANEPDKGQLKYAVHLIQLLRKILRLVPEGAEVILLGQVEFYGEVLSWVEKYTTWRFVLSNWQTSLIRHPSSF